MKKKCFLTLSAGHQRVPNPGEVVSTAPDGRLGGVLPRIQASKSMQNLEQVNYHPTGSY
jgi:hypothetical protein